LQTGGDINKRSAEFVQEVLSDTHCFFGSSSGTLPAECSIALQKVNQYSCLINSDSTPWVWLLLLLGATWCLLQAALWGPGLLLKKLLMLVLVLLACIGDKVAPYTVKQQRVLQIRSIIPTGITESQPRGQAA
jgi:hypothetical protein